jgi:hypothetical protein
LKNYLHSDKKNVINIKNCNLILLNSINVNANKKIRNKKIMKSIKLKGIVIFILVLSIRGYAQESIPSLGGNASGSGGSASYTISQVAYSSQIGSNGSVAQGVQQPFEISVTLGLEEAKGITLRCTVYPNPTTKSVTLNIENYDIKNLSYLIFDLNGRSISSKKISGNETFISMENLAATTYFIKIMDLNKELKIFKIIKKD